MYFKPTARQSLIAGFAISALIALLMHRPALADDATAACDTLAAARFDQDRPASVTPVNLGKIDVAKAQPACEAAVAAKGGERRLIYELGRVQLANKDYGKALDSFKKASDLGSAMATSDLASMHEAGLGTPKDPVMARTLAQKAADAGNAQAEFNLAMMNVKGHGGPKDFTKARALFEKAASAGVPEAYYRLGYGQEFGAGGPADLPQAKASYTTCASLTDAGVYQRICQLRLGYMYETGKVGRMDPLAAKELFEKSAAAGDTEALRALGQVYEQGKGVRPDAVKARDFFEKAAAKGDAFSMRQLSEIYARGAGVARDAAVAKSWADKAKIATETEKALQDADEAP